MLSPSLVLALDGEALLERVGATIRAEFYDGGLRGKDLGGLLERYRPQVREARDRAETYAVLNRMLGELGASHTQILPREVFDAEYACEFAGKTSLRFGLELRETGGRYFVHVLLEGGPAAECGILAGDEVVTLDGKPVSESPHLWPVGDAGKAPHHLLMAPDSRSHRLGIRREPGGELTVIRLRAAPWSRTRASRASRSILEVSGLRLLYFHLHHVIDGDVVSELKKAVRAEDEDGLLVDLRGWGGNAYIAKNLEDFLARYSDPVVLLIDQDTRSAKEIVAFNLQKRGILTVGRRTAGAVLGVGFFHIDDEAVLLLPIMDVKWLTGTRLEGRGVRPDIGVPADPPYAAGRDAVLEAGTQALIELLRGPTQSWDF